jgi:hypothetical protein
MHSCLSCLKISVLCGLPGGISTQSISTDVLLFIFSLTHCNKPTLVGQTILRTFMELEQNLENVGCQEKQAQRHGC